jgi:ATP-binding cassette subfamily B protein
MFMNLDVEAYDREYSDRVLVRRAVAYFASDRRRWFLIVSSTSAVAVLGALLPVLVARGVGLLDTSDDTQLLIGVVVAVFAVNLLMWFANYVRRRETARGVADVVKSLRLDAFRAAMSHDMSFYDRFASGKIVTRITTDTQAFGDMVNVVAQIVAELLQLVILVVILFTISPQLTLLLALWAPVVMLMAFGFRHLARRATRQGSRAMGEVNGLIFETVAGIAVAKNFRREQAVYDAFDGVNRQSYQINVRRGFVLSAVFPVLNILVGFGMALIMFFGGLSVLEGAIAAGAWFLFFQSIDAFWFPLIDLSAFASQIQAGFAALERVFALVDATPAVVQHDSEPVAALSGDIRFDGVVFAYDTGDVVLPNFDLHIRPGETVALVGHTGAGKSSVAKLVERFYEFQGGTLSIDGRDIRTLDLNDYRCRLGIVPQVPFLFSGTVAENIRYSSPDVTDAEIEALARRIGEGEWLDALPEGLATEVGERGNRLSMGQRQLVALMRVLVQQPAIFLLDEATASVDPFTESQIQEALDLVLAGRTSIVIAHRLTTVRAADRILVMQAGTVIEEGSHEALMSAGGHYAELYDTYFRHQSLDYRVAPDVEAIAEAAAVLA